MVDLTPKHKKIKIKKITQANSNGESKQPKKTKINSKSEKTGGMITSSALTTQPQSLFNRNSNIKKDQIKNTYHSNKVYRSKLNTTLPVSLTKKSDKPITIFKLSDPSHYAISKQIDQPRSFRNIDLDNVTKIIKDLEFLDKEIYEKKIRSIFLTDHDNLTVDQFDQNDPPNKPPINTIGSPSNDCDINVKIDENSKVISTIEQCKSFIFTDELLKLIQELIDITIEDLMKLFNEIIIINNDSLIKSVIIAIVVNTVFDIMCNNINIDACNREEFKVVVSVISNNHGKPLIVLVSKVIIGVLKKKINIVTLQDLIKEHVIKTLTIKI